MGSAILLLIGRILYLVIVVNIHNYDEPVWQPYQQGDSMVFFNNRGDTVCCGIYSIENVSNPSSPLSPLEHWIFSTFVNTSEFETIIDVSEELGVKRIDFEPLFQRGNIEVIEGEKNQTNLGSINYNQMDLLKITPHPNDLLIEPYLQMIYWSSQYGYVKVFYSDGEIWELNTLNRNGEIIYELHNEQ